MFAPESSHQSSHHGHRRLPRSLNRTDPEPWRNEQIRRIFYNKGIDFYFSRKIGAGFFSSVVTARSAQHGSVAVKIVNTALVPNHYKNSFLPRELSLWRRLVHPNLIRMLGQYELKNFIFLKMEFGHGGDLLRYVQTYGAVQEAKASKWMIQIMHGVRHMHSLYIAHRDLKLENIIVFNDDTVKIADFGFATEAINRRSTTFCGSRSYVAPEILEGKPYDPFKSDIWSMGVVAFVMITDRMPFDESRSNEEMVHCQRQRTYAYPSRPTLPFTTRRAIDHMLTYSPEMRPNATACFNLSWPTAHYVINPQR